MMRGFLKIHPEFNGRDLYITGESYAGKYVPAIAQSLQFEATDIDLNLRGISIGNGMTNPYAQGN